MNDSNSAEDNKITLIVRNIFLTFDSACFAVDLVFLLALPPEEEVDAPEAPPLPPDVADESA